MRQRAAREWSIVSGRNDGEAREDLVCKRSVPINESYEGSRTLQRTVSRPSPAGDEARLLALPRTYSPSHDQSYPLGRCWRATQNRSASGDEAKDELADGEDGIGEAVHKVSVCGSRLNENGSFGTGDRSCTNDDISKSSQEGVDLHESM